jgi:hypothetical protein
MTPLDELRQLAPPPADPTPLPIGDLPVPADYSTLAATYGQGEFCDLIFLETPDDEQLDYDREARQEYPEYYPYPLHPEPGGLLPWGATSNGALLCWLTAGPPDNWRVVIWNQRDSEYEEHPMGATAFLAGWLAGRVTSELLPSVMRDLAQWFDPPRKLTHVSVQLSPHTQALDTLRAAIGDTVLRRTSGDQHIVATDAWRVTYNPSYLELAFPPRDKKRIRSTVERIAADLGCEILSAEHFDGTTAWKVTRG